MAAKVKIPQWAINQAIAKEQKSVDPNATTTGPVEKGSNKAELDQATGKGKPASKKKSKAPPNKVTASDIEKEIAANPFAQMGQGLTKGLEAQEKSPLSRPSPGI